MDRPPSWRPFSVVPDFGWPRFRLAPISVGRTPHAASISRMTMRAMPGAVWMRRNSSYPWRVWQPGVDQARTPAGAGTARSRIERGDLLLAYVWRRERQHGSV